MKSFCNPLNHTLCTCTGFEHWTLEHSCDVICQHPFASYIGGEPTRTYCMLFQAKGTRNSHAKHKVWLSLSKKVKCPGNHINDAVAVYHSPQFRFVRFLHSRLLCAYQTRTSIISLTLAGILWKTIDDRNSCFSPNVFWLAV